jgi:hypothetical protein
MFVFSVPLDLRDDGSVWRVSWGEETRENLRRTIAAHAPMAWAHINMLGEYDFSDDKLRDALGILPPKKAA